MAVGAEESQIFELRLLARLQCRDRPCVMTLDEAIAPFAILGAEIELAGLATQSSVFPKGLRFPSLNNSAIALTTSMQTSEDLTLFGFLTVLAVS
jgi:hypothetical protein